MAKGGWGVTYQDVYLMDNLTIESKAIYGMLCSYAGMGATAYPSIELMCSKLHISHARFYKHMNLLVDAGIVIKQTVRNGRGLIEKTLYTLTPNLQDSIFPLSPMLDKLTVDNLMLDNLTADSLTVDSLLVDNLTSNNNNINNNNIYIIVEYLNEKAGTHYKASTAKTKSLINARLKEGFTVDDFKTVIDKKVKEWLKDVKMAKYIRPETLFGTKFEGYLNEKGSSCTGATNNRFNNFHQRENNLTDKELEMMLVDNNKKAPQ